MPTMNKAEHARSRSSGTAMIAASSYLSLRRRCYYSFVNGCWMVPLWGMMIGIESDGFTHS